MSEEIRPPASVPGQCYLVGGAVRDRLLQRPVVDRDWVVCGSTPQAMQDAGFKAVGQDFPVFLHPQSGEEFALARTERKTGRGYGGFSFHADPDVTLEEDLERRDLTINAMALAADGQLIDPYGGQRDLQARVLRHVSPSFVEDPLRVLRVARFYARYQALGFQVAEETLQLMRDIAERGELQDLTAERVWQETARALLEARPAEYFRLLRNCGALEQLFPEIDALFGVPQTPKYHPEIDSGIHTLMALEQACRFSRSLELRFAVLCHDLGKATTPDEVLPGHRGHEGRGVAIIETLCQRLKTPKELKQIAQMVAGQHLLCHKALELRPATLLKLLQKLDVFRRAERLEIFLQACEADARGRTGLEEEPYPQADYLRGAFRAAWSVQAADVMTPEIQGPAIGQALDAARIKALDQYKQAYQNSQNNSPPKAKR